MIQGELLIVVYYHREGVPLTAISSSKDGVAACEKIPVTQWLFKRKMLMGETEIDSNTEDVHLTNISNKLYQDYSLMGNHGQYKSNMQHTGEI